LLAKGPGCRVSAMHWRIISWLWGMKSCLTEAIYERFEWFALFLSYAQEGDCGSLVWTAANKMGGEHV